MGTKMSSMEYCRFRSSKIIEIIENRGKLSTDFKHTLCNVFQTKIIVFRIFFLVVKKTPNQFTSLFQDTDQFT